VPDLPLSAIFEKSPVLERFRSATLARRAQALADPFRFLTGGGDIEHAYVFSAGDDGEGDFTAPDPYYPIAVALAQRAMRRHGTAGLNRPAAAIRRPSSTRWGQFDRLRSPTAPRRDASPDAPLQLRPLPTSISPGLSCAYYGRRPSAATGQRAGDHGIFRVKFDASSTVRESMSLDGPLMGNIWGDIYRAEDVTITGPRMGTTPVGSFHFEGVDMTDPMLAVAAENKPIVAANLGYDAVEFRKGFLESIPVEDKSVDAVTSNCVVNLSPDKGKVFSEIWRVLKDHGRAVIADIVSEREVAPHLKTNSDLGGCRGSADRGRVRGGAGRRVHGVEILKKVGSRSRHPFYSVTVRGWKFENRGMRLTASARDISARRRLSWTRKGARSRAGLDVGSARYGGRLSHAPSPGRSGARAGNGNFSVAGSAAARLVVRPGDGMLLRRS
jgi:SAM-dependent methyltransferase